MFCRVQWVDPRGRAHASPRMESWLDAAGFRAELIISGRVTMPCAARIVGCR